MITKKFALSIALASLIQTVSCDVTAHAYPVQVNPAGQLPASGEKNMAKAPQPALQTVAQHSRSDDPLIHVKTIRPEIIYDLTQLPQPVRKMRERILKAAKTGDIEALRPLIITEEDNERPVRPVDHKEDPVNFLKTLSGDGEGMEILAIIVDLLNSGCVRLAADSKQEVYVWPYFVAIPLDKLSKSQTVEAYQIMTASDFDMIKEIGNYIFFRIGISPEGKWRFLATGDPSDQETE